MATLLKIAPSRIPGSGQGVFLEGRRPSSDFVSENVISIGRDVGEYVGTLYSEGDPSLVKNQLVYSFELPNGKVLVGEGVLSRVNDIVDFRQLTPRETFDFDRRKVLPTVLNLMHNVDWVVRKRNSSSSSSSSYGVYMRAIREIKPGDELYVSYGFSYWETMYRENCFLAEY
jgi:hypothetical protein